MERTCARSIIAYYFVCCERFSTAIRILRGTPFICTYRDTVSGLRFILRATAVYVPNSRQSRCISTISVGDTLGAPILFLVLVGLLGLLGGLQMGIGMLHSILPTFVDVAAESLFGGVCSAVFSNHFIDFFQFGGVVPRHSDMDCRRPFSVS